MAKSGNPCSLNCITQNAEIGCPWMRVNITVDRADIHQQLRIQFMVDL